MATYKTSHPWLSFQLDLAKSRFTFWLMAGEAISKTEHIAGVALGPEAAAELMKVYLVKGALATTAIEGNTLSEEDVRKRVDGHLNLPPSKEYLGIEIDNIVKASNEILEACLQDKLPPLTPETIQSFNAKVLANLSLEGHISPGVLRTYSVGVVDYRGAPHQDLRELLTELCQWLSQPWVTGLEHYSTAEQLRLDAIFKAIIAHIYLAWIHPFGDGNGRTARLVEFYLLIAGGVPFPAAHLLSNHYNETRGEYYRQLSYASKSGGDVGQFMLYALRGFVDQLREQIGVIRGQQLELFWKNHVHETLGDSETARRRRYLVLDLAKQPHPVAKEKITEISVRVLKHYINKGDKTLERDLQELESLKLILREGDQYQANTNIVLAYLTPKRLSKPVAG